MIAKFASDYIEAYENPGEGVDGTQVEKQNTIQGTANMLKYFPVRFVALFTPLDALILVRRAYRLSLASSTCYSPGTLCPGAPRIMQNGLNTK